MKSSQLTQYKSQKDYLAKNGGAGVRKMVGPLKTDKSVEEVEGQLAGKAHKVELSKEAIEKEANEKIQENKKEIKSASSHLLKDATEVASKALTKALPTPVKIPLKVSAQVPTLEERQKDLSDISKGPGVYFIEGMSLIGMSSSDSGLSRMAQSFPEGKKVSWREEEAIIERIKKTPPEAPIVLIGHSLGGDSAVSIAKKLNTLENGFRDVELMVTLDSVGFDNDIIPTNVKKNLNFISDEDVFFNDGPNIARDNDLTEVVNELRKENHTSIDDSEDVQRKVVRSVQRIYNMT